MPKFFPPPLPEHRSYDVVGFGLNAVDHLILVPCYPAFNSKVRFTEHKVAPGGQVATAMVGLARLAHSTSYIGRIGEDEEGKLQLRSLIEEGVDVSEVKVSPGAASQTAFIIVDQSSGERTIIWDRDDRLNFDPRAIDRRMIQCARVLHLDGHDIPASIRAAELAREAGMPVVIDVDNHYPGIEELLHLVTCVIASADFPARLTGETELSEALRKIQQQFGNPLVVATQGAEGAVALCEDVWVRSPAFRIDCVDTTGAGDAFRAGFIHGLLLGQGLEELLRTANAVAALNCRALGARGGLPDRTQLEAFLRDSLKS